MHQKEHIIRTIETDQIIVGMRSDEIVHVYFKDNTEINILLQDQMVKVYEQVCGLKKYPFIFELGVNCSITKEARDYAIEIEADKPVLASAVVVNNAIYKLIANFYYKFNKPQKPYKVFRKFDEAIAWLLNNKKH